MLTLLERIKQGIVQLPTKPFSYKDFTSQYKVSTSYARNVIRCLEEEGLIYVSGYEKLTDTSERRGKRGKVYSIKVSIKQKNAKAKAQMEKEAADKLKKSRAERRAKQMKELQEINRQKEEAKKSMQESLKPIYIGGAKRYGVLGI